MVTLQEKYAKQTSVECNSLDNNSKGRYIDTIFKQKSILFLGNVSSQKTAVEISCNFVHSSTRSSRFSDASLAIEKGYDN